MVTEALRFPSTLVFTISTGTRHVLSWQRSNLHQRTEDRANAQLIAAAPDLLAACDKQREALKSCILYFLKSGPKPDVEDLAMAEIAGIAALKKAGGP